MIQGAKIIRETPQSDGSYQVTISVSLCGAINSITSIALPQLQVNIVPQNIPSPAQTALVDTPTNTLIHGYNS